MNKHPEYILEIIDLLKSAQSREEMYQILDNAVKMQSNFFCQDDTCFIDDDFKFQCTLKLYANRYDVEAINKESKWKIIQIIPIGNSDRCVIVSHKKIRL